jgi:hypothetical protein
MRHSIEIPSFIGGILAGLAAVGVTLLTIGVARRVRATRAAGTDRMRWLDGAHPVPAALLDALPAAEGNAPPRRLASEAVDAPVESQRW